MTNNNFRNLMIGMNVIIFLSFALGNAQNTIHKEVGFHYLGTDPHGFNKALFWKPQNFFEVVFDVCIVELVCI